MPTKTVQERIDQEDPTLPEWFQPQLPGDAWDKLLMSHEKRSNGLEITRFERYNAETNGVDAVREELP
ncbi:MAG: hypothetical protein GWN93_23905 [Deltaproteobacteria bacterium]|nr:hypothetical protein [Deltaproteobacteria bacterium]